MFTKAEKRVGLKRLTKLADFLATVVEPKKFDLDSWINKSDEAEDQGLLGIDALNNGCGTTACALGWACAIPSFKRAGLKIIDSGTYWGGLHPEFEGKSTFDAGAAFFRISMEDSNNLFDPYNYNSLYRSKAYVIRRIRATVKRLEKELNKE